MISSKAMHLIKLYQNKYYVKEFVPALKKTGPLCTIMILHTFQEADYEFKENQRQYFNSYGDFCNFTRAELYVGINS